ncbi:hypothetical protein BDV96DRAFT_598055 [Lophiotrema nucula]|uniref:Uncharacterized protein n=1 Tax=Lophiotrema nucula TaxID=690887 RepID=A0A6A5ZC64_9PLEO|nr:hypothetical protein BDV96DRAFT_598055 [Lophiotrema nucula]
MKTDSAVLAQKAEQHRKLGFALAKKSNELTTKHRAVKNMIIAPQKQSRHTLEALQTQERELRTERARVESSAMLNIRAYSNLTSPILCAKILTSGLPRELRDEIYRYLLPCSKFEHRERSKLDLPFYCGYTPVGKAFMTELVQLLYRTSFVSFSSLHELLEPVFKGVPVVARDYASKFNVYDVNWKDPKALELLLGLANKNADIGLRVNGYGMGAGTFKNLIRPHLTLLKQLEDIGHRLTISYSNRLHREAMFGFQAGTSVGATLDAWVYRFRDCESQHNDVYWQIFL